MLTTVSIEGPNDEVVSGLVYTMYLEGRKEKEWNVTSQLLLITH